MVNMLSASRHLYENGAAIFNPCGKPVVSASIGARENPFYDDQYKETWSARFIIGFNVGMKTVYTMKDAIAIVKKARKKQTGYPDSTFIAQKGFYTYEGEGKYHGRVTKEPGVQVVIFNVPPAYKPLRQFRTDVLELAVYVCKVMKQEKVIVDLYKDGLQAEASHIVGWSDEVRKDKKPLTTSLK